MNIPDIKYEIDEWLKNYFINKGSYNKIIYDAMSYSLNVGGKRIRPILLLLTYSIYKENYKEVLPVACALEMIHTYSLIHDDLPCMDNDDLRRGKPTNHKVFGDAIATLAGDALLNEAMSLLFDYCVDKGRSEIKACNLISKSAGAEGMIAGQVVDIINEGKSIGVEELYYMHSKKTGELIKSSILAGAILANASQKDIEILNSYGEKLGLAFQIKDDILDVVGETSTLGKKIKSDANNNKVTFVTTFGIEKCKKMCEELTDECFQLLDRISEDTLDLKEITLFLLKRNY